MSPNIIKKGAGFYHFLAIFVVCVWGLTFVSTKYLLNVGLSSVEIFFVRFAVAYSGILLVSHRQAFCSSVKDEMMCLLLGLSGGSLYFIIENLALEKSTASNVSLIVCTAPVFTLALSNLLKKSGKFPPRLLIGILLSLFGVACLTIGQAKDLHFNSAGDLLALSAALLWAGYTMILENLAKRYSSSFITRKTFFYGLVTSIPLVIFSGDHSRLDLFLQGGVMANLAFLGIVASLFCYFAWSKALKVVGTVRTTNYLYLNPVVAVIASALILGEQITPMRLLGMAIVFLGLYLSQTQSRKTR